MPDANGKPMAGEWWGGNAPCFYMVGLNTEGRMVFQCDDGSVDMAVTGD